jgi:hypothetical protein
MTSSTSRQRRLDTAAFPVRLRLLVAEEGSATDLAPMQRWLDERSAAGHAAYHVHLVGGRRIMEVHLRRMEDVVAFFETFPGLPLDDRTMAGGYLSPSLPSGRRA